MNDNWKPGDVAMTAKNTVAMCHSNGRMIDVNGGPWSNDTFPENLRRLVVIDPEDREQVERLASLLWPHYSKVEAAHLRKSDVTADALREFANPIVKPEEPTGLGAVVEDAVGRKWVRTEDPDDPWQAYLSFDLDDYDTYANIDVVRVLSSGVTQ